jgi:hypothetical protein
VGSTCQAVTQHVLLLGAAASSDLASPVTRAQGKWGRSSFVAGFLHPTSIACGMDE